jgi:hypothetical protein
MGAFSPPATSTPTSNTVLSVSSSPPSSLLNCPTADHHLSHHLTLAERMSMSLLSHHAARPMNLLCAPQPKVRTRSTSRIDSIKNFLGTVRELTVGLDYKSKERDQHLQWWSGWGEGRKELIFFLTFFLFFYFGNL